MHRHAIVALAFAWVDPASAMVRVGSDGNATVSALEIAVEPGAWIVRARLEGSARQVALVFPAAASSASIEDVSVLDARDHATAPRFEVIEPRDPCSAGEDEPKPFWPERKTPVFDGWDARVTTLVDPLLDAESKAAVSRMLRGGRKLVVSRGPAPGKLRGFWTPAVRINTEGAIPVGLVAPQITVGRDLRIDLFTSLAPKQPIVDLPAGIALPEVALEDPLDLLRAATSQAIRREGRGTAVRIHTERWAIEIGRKDERAVVELEERALAPFTAKWIIRKAWKKPIHCEGSERFRNIIRIQQKNEIQTYAAITGRPQSTIEALMRERGYLVERF